MDAETQRFVDLVVEEAKGSCPELEWGLRLAFNHAYQQGLRDGTAQGKEICAQEYKDVIENWSPAGEIVK